MKDLISYVPNNLQKELVVAEVVSHALLIIQTHINISDTTTDKSELVKKVLTQVGKVMVDVDLKENTWSFDWSKCNRPEVVGGQYHSAIEDLNSMEGYDNNELDIELEDGDEEVDMSDIISEKKDDLN